MMGNKLTALPDSVCQLTSLYRLGLKGNQLEALPDSFGNLQNLVELFLTDNALKSLPDSMQGCTALVKLQVCAVLSMPTGCKCVCITALVNQTLAGEPQPTRAFARYLGPSAKARTNASGHQQYL